MDLEVELGEIERDKEKEREKEEEEDEVEEEDGEGEARRKVGDKRKSVSMSNIAGKNVGQLPLRRTNSNTRKRKEILKTKENESDAEKIEFKEARKLLPGKKKKGRILREEKEKKVKEEDDELINEYGGDDGVIMNPFANSRKGKKYEYDIKDKIKQGKSPKSGNPVRKGDLNFGTWNRNRTIRGKGDSLTPDTDSNYVIDNDVIDSNFECLVKDIDELISDACYFSRYAGFRAGVMSILSNLAVVLVILLTTAAAIILLGKIANSDIREYIAGVLTIMAGAVEALRSTLCIEERGKIMKDIQGASMAIARKAKALKMVNLPSYRINDEIDRLSEKLFNLKYSLYETAITTTTTSNEFANRIVSKETGDAVARGQAGDMGFVPYDRTRVAIEEDGEF